MDKFLSHYSAAEFWEIPHLDLILGQSKEELKCAHYTYFNSEKRYASKDQKAYLCQGPLPSGAVIRKRKVIVASPELLFVQLASKLDAHRLILLGLQLCSHVPGKPSEAITTTQKLRNFTAKMEGQQGYRKATIALKHIENGSASIMEAMAYMILALPHTLGGYGFDGPFFNFEIKIKDEFGKQIGLKRCFADLYYKSAKVAVEYDSFAFHNSPAEQGKDALRAAILERQGIAQMSLRTIQLYNQEACRDFAHNLAKRLGKRLRIRSKNFEQMNRNLRNLLPTLSEDREEDILLT